MMNVIIVLLLLAVGYGVGSLLEKRHFARIVKREEELKDILLIPSKHLPENMQTDNFSNTFVDGNVVISVDYFKRFIAGLRALVGGRVRTYETLLERGRREAIVRMKEKAMACDAVMVLNCKLETASISKGAKNSVGSVEVYAYGTAVSGKADAAEFEPSASSEVASSTVVSSAVA